MPKLLINISLAALAALSLVLVGLIGLAITEVSMFTAFAPIWQAAWGKVAMVDLYLGLLIGAVLVLIHQQGRWPGWLWALAILGLGNPVIVLYLIYHHRALKKLLNN